MRTIRASPGAASRRYCAMSLAIFGRQLRNVASIVPYPSKMLDDSASSATAAVLAELKKDGAVHGLSLSTGRDLPPPAIAAVCESLGSMSSFNRLGRVLNDAGLAAISRAVGQREDEPLSRLMTSCAGGSAVLMAFDEGEAGEDFNRMTTAATETVNGPLSYAIDGSKVLAIPFCDVDAESTVLLIAKGNVDGTRRCSLFCTQQGQVVKGENGSWPRVILNSTPAEIVGIRGMGISLVQNALTAMQNGQDAAIVGACKKAMAAVSGDPVTWKLCAADVYAMESVVYAVAAQLTTESPPPIRSVQWPLASTAVRLLAQRIARRVWSVEPAAAGSLRALLMALGKESELPLKAACIGLEAFGVEFERQSTLSVLQERTLLAFGIHEHLPISLPSNVSGQKLLEKTLIAFANACESAYVEFHHDLRNEEAVLLRLGRCAALLYSSIAALSRAATSAAQKSPTAAAVEIPLSLALCHMIAEEVQLQCSVSKGDSAGVLLGGFTGEWCRLVVPITADEAVNETPNDATNGGVEGDPNACKRH